MTISKSKLYELIHVINTTILDKTVEDKIINIKLKTFNGSIEFKLTYDTDFSVKDISYIRFKYDKLNLINEYLHDIQHNILDMENIYNFFMFIFYTGYVDIYINDIRTLIINKNNIKKIVDDKIIIGLDTAMVSIFDYINSSIINYNAVLKAYAIAKNDPYVLASEIESSISNYKSRFNAIKQELIELFDNINIYLLPVD